MKFFRNIYNQNGELIVSAVSCDYSKESNIASSITYHYDYSINNKVVENNVETADIILINPENGEEDEVELFDDLVRYVGIRKALGYMKKIHCLPTTLLDEEE